MSSTYCPFHPPCLFAVAVGGVKAELSSLFLVQGGLLSGKLFLRGFRPCRQGAREAEKMAGKRTKPPKLPSESWYF